MPPEDGQGPGGYFQAVYAGVPPWEIGGPQPVFVRLEEAGEITGTVLDVGCGTGENALYLASRGHEVWGIDYVPAAIEKARAKARERGLGVTFVEGNALNLGKLGRSFDTIIDCGLFHSLSDGERPRLVRTLAAVLTFEGRYFMLCFSERELREGGPRRVTQAEIRAAFREGWTINYIVGARFESRIHPGGAQAWLSSITRC
jgi:ubiquinone/menaquinone biosynthesis C-methylase UbiE